MHLTVSHTGNYCISCKQLSSELLTVLSGVPQAKGALLLFIIFINDLPSQVLRSTLPLFADDTKCAKSIASDIDHRLLQNDLNSLNSWSHKWNLPVNEINADSFTFRVRLMAIHVLTPSMETASTSHKALGFHFTNSLNWEDHYNL